MQQLQEINKEIEGIIDKIIPMQKTIKVNEKKKLSLYTRKKFNSILTNNRLYVQLVWIQSHLNNLNESIKKNDFIKIIMEHSNSFGALKDFTPEQKDMQLPYFDEWNKLHQEVIASIDNIYTKIENSKKPNNHSHENQAIKPNPKSLNQNQTTTQNLSQNVKSTFMKNHDEYISNINPSLMHDTTTCSNSVKEKVLQAMDAAITTVNKSLVEDSRNEKAEKLTVLKSLFETTPTMTNLQVFIAVCQAHRTRVGFNFFGMSTETASLKAFKKALPPNLANQIFPQPTSWFGFSKK